MECYEGVTRELQEYLNLRSVMSPFESTWCGSAPHRHRRSDGDAIGVLQWCYRGVIVMTQWLVLQRCYRGVIEVLQRGDKGAALVLSSECLVR
jgi:hypothetical protein